MASRNSDSDFVPDLSAARLHITVKGYQPADKLVEFQFAHKDARKRNLFVNYSSTDFVGVTYFFGAVAGPAGEWRTARALPARSADYL